MQVTRYGVVRCVPPSQRAERWLPSARPRSQLRAAQGLLRGYLSVGGDYNCTPDDQACENSLKPVPRSQGDPGKCDVEDARISDNTLRPEAVLGDIISQA